MSGRYFSNMNSTTKKHLIESFMRSQPHKDPNMRFTEVDVKAVVYQYISASCGEEDFSSLSDSICREKIQRDLEEKVKVAREGTLYKYGPFVGTLSDVLSDIVNPEILECSSKDVRGNIASILPNLIHKYLEETPSQTYTTIRSLENFEKLVDLLRSLESEIF